MRILVSVIAYNEEKNIETTLSDLQKNNFGFDIIVVDNSSTDKTQEICESLNIPCISHCINTGSSMGTVYTYFLFAYKNDYDILCQFDGDGQHIASELKKIIGPIESGEADYVIGSRFITGEGFQSSFLRRIGIKLFSTIISLIAKKKITDVTSGFRAYNKKVISTFALKNKIELQDVNQLLLFSIFNNIQIKEVPVIMKEREAGVSEFNFFNAVMFPLKGLVNILGCWLEK